MVFTTAELTTLLGALRLSRQARAFDRDVAFMSTETGLLLGDTSWNVGLRLAETFEVRQDDTLSHGLAFFADEARYDINQALAASGYTGSLPVSNLANAALAFWGSEGRVYVTSASTAGTSLVASEGLFGGLAGRIRSLQAGTGMSVTLQNDAVVLSASAQPDLTGYVPYSVYTPFSADVQANAVFRRVLGSMQATLLSPGVQLVDETTTDLRVSNSFEIVQGAVLTGTIPEVGITMLAATRMKRAPSLSWLPSAHSRHV